MLIIVDLKTEYRKNPIGIDALHPRFSWKLSSDRENVVQRAYQIFVSCDGREVWNSGKVNSSQSQNVLFGGTVPDSGKRLQWKVAVWTDEESAVSGEAFFEMALMKKEDWKAIWIQPEREIDYDEYKPASYLRRRFQVRPGLVRARIYQSAHGLYEFWINGAEGTKERFKPGITSYHHRIQYQTYDILPLLKEGENIWGVQLGDGWWRGNTGGGNRNNFGFYTSFIGQIILDYKDGTKEIIGTDEQFRTATGAILRCDMKVGEIYDARRERNGWKLYGYDDSSWKPVIPASEYASLDVLIPSRSVPVLEKEELPGRVFTDQAGSRVIDFGQNHAGYVRMTLRNTKPGQKITLTHGEGLKEGVFSMDNLEETSKDPMQEIVYICQGAQEETYKPKFAVFGYRYVKIEGYEGEIQPGDFVSIAVYSDMEEAGGFTCSNPLLNQLADNCRWSMKSNFLDAPTDCPTRERSTWSGDAQVYCRTASEFMNVYPFFEKWLLDLNAEQFEDGCVGNTIPSTNALHNADERERMLKQGRFVFAPPTMAGPKGCGDMMDGAAGWGDVATILPYTMYLCYGDRQILSQQYESAKRWVAFERKNAKKQNPLYEEEPQYHTGQEGVLDADYIYDTHFHWGEWLEPGSAENGGSQAFDPMAMAKEGNPLVATAYLYYSHCLMARMASILGKQEEAQEYSQYAANVKRVYNKYFIREDGTILEGKQAPYVRTLRFGLAEKEKETMVADKLAGEVERSGYTVNTGFLSTPFILGELTAHGYKEHAFRMLEQTAFPGWLHPVTLGATTTLENWDGFDKYRASFNHYSYGAVYDFMISHIAGIQPVESEPGYKKIRIAPLIGGTLTFAEGHYLSPYGMISSSWKLDGKKAVFDIEIPANTTAEIVLPTEFVNLERILDTFAGKIVGNDVVFSLGSGKYRFG